MERNRSVELSSGRIHYRDMGTAGAADPIVFVHGLLVDGSLWRKVLPALEAEFRCIVPDWPLGSHREAMRPDADLSPHGVARLIAEFLERLDLERVTLVANDTGGAIAQLLVTRHPQRVGKLVLTPCDAYENFLPPAFRPMQYMARVPGLLNLMVGPLRIRRLRRLPIAYGAVAKRPIPDAVTDAWLRPFFSDRGVRRDTAKLLSAISNRDTLQAARELEHFEAPTLIAWAPEDRFFRLEYAERLAAAIPDARLETIADSSTFVSEDQPGRLAELIAAFARGAPQQARSGAGAHGAL